MRDALRTVTDPEYPVNLVDLGLVYGIAVEDGRVQVDLTFTSVGCPALEMIVHDARHALLAVPGVREVHITPVWSPPWTRQRISERGRRLLACCGVVA